MAERRGMMAERREMMASQVRREMVTARRDDGREESIDGELFCEHSKAQAQDPQRMD